MNAAELNFPAPTGDTPSWAAMAQSVFNGQSNRWDDHCGGGLRWQMFAFNNGYNYKNVAANGGLFLLSAKLARYTGNTTFVDSVEKQWEWFSNSVLYQPDNFQVNDGTDIGNNCTKPNTQQWSYNYGFYIAGLAYIYNHVSACQIYLLSTSNATNTDKFSLPTRPKTPNGSPPSKASSTTPSPNSSPKTTSPLNPPANQKETATSTASPSKATPCAGSPSPRNSSPPSPTKSGRTSKPAASQPPRNAAAATRETSAA